MNYKSDRGEFSAVLSVYNLEILNDADLGLNSIISPTEKIKKTERMIEKIEKIFDEKSIEEINEILGGELNIRGREDDQAPLYFQLDIIIKYFEMIYLKQYPNKELIKDLLDKLYAVREKTAGLTFDKKFKPNETIDEVVIQDIIKNRGTYQIDSVQVGNKSFLAINIIKTYYTNQTYDSELGAYVGIGEATIESHGGRVLYNSDKIEIQNIQKAEKQKRVEKKINEIMSKLNKIMSRHFKDGKIPSTSEFSENLINPNIDDNLKQALFKIVKVVEENKNNEYRMTAILSNEKLLENVISIEQNIAKLHIEQEKEQQEKAEKFKKAKSDFKNSAKRAYEQRTFFWRFINKQLDPETKNFEEMNEEEFENVKAEYKKKGLC